MNETSIYTTPLKFIASSFPTTPPPSVGEEDGAEDPTEPPQEEEEGEEEGDERAATEGEDTPTPPWEFNDRRSSREAGEKRQWDLIEGIANGLTGGSKTDKDEQEGGSAVYEVPSYTAPVHYNVPKTGYYCVGELFLVTSSQSTEEKLIGRNRTGYVDQREE